MLIEAAWSYRYPPRVAIEEAEIVVRLPKLVRDMAVKGQNSLKQCRDRMHLTY
jgi:transposase